VTATPWGRAEDLRARRLRPGPGASREEVDRNQRERLFGAMVIAVAENGYEKTRVADLLRISGVSRNTFYRQFKNKEDCFLATVDAIVAVGGEFVVTAFRESEGDWGDRLATGLTALFELIAEHPSSSPVLRRDLCRRRRGARQGRTHGRPDRGARGRRDGTVAATSRHAS
jgi:AcrR family transcriptional regulator